MNAGDEFYDDDVTSGVIDPPVKSACVWCEDWADGFDPDPCPDHSKGGDE